MVYSKVLNYVLDLVALPKIRGSNVRADNMVGKDSQVHHEVMANLKVSNTKYREDANKHKHFKNISIRAISDDSSS